MQTMTTRTRPDAEARPAPAGRLVAEGFIDLPAAAALFPRVRGRGVSVKSVWRWITRGRSGVKLDGIRMAGEWWTSQAAVGRFLTAVSEKEQGS